MKVFSLLSLKGGVDYSSVYQTPVLDGNYDNYVITDLQKYSTLVFNSSDDVKIRGLDATNVNPWQSWIVINNSDNNLKFEYNKGTSLANNRLEGDRAFNIPENCAVMLVRSPLINKFLVLKLT